MPTWLFPTMPLDDWRPTRDTVHQYCRIAGKVRAFLTPPQKQWWHVSLRAHATGLTTTPMPAESGAVEIVLDLVEHAIVARSSRGDALRTDLSGQSPLDICNIVMDQLHQIGANPEVDRDEFSADSAAYDRAAVERYWRAASQMDLLLKQFRSEQQRETSPVQLWPHHFDWALSWFSGRPIPDAAGGYRTGEELMFGFSTGDEWIPEPYLYILAHPFADAWLETDLPVDAYWHTHGFNGAVMLYSALVDTPNPDQKLLGFWRTVLDAGKSLMDAGEPLRE